MIHQNSIASHTEIKPSIPARKHIILGIYETFNRPLTDREVLRYLGESDMNFARPRISELIVEGKLKECGNVIDTLTKKRVRLVRIKRPEENTQSELF